jgi:hypothetical protein
MMTNKLRFGPNDSPIGAAHIDDYYCECRMFDSWRRLYHCWYKSVFLISTYYRGKDMLLTNFAKVHEDQRRIERELWT